MRKALPIVLLIAGLAIIGYGLTEKDHKQTHVDLGVAEANLGKKDSVFTPYFIIGGITAAAGLVLLVSGRKN